MQIPFEVDSPQKDEISKKEAPISNPSILHISQRTQDLENPTSKQEKKPLTVSQLTRQISLLLEGKFRSLTVEGELSNLKRAASGHWYFCLKDHQSPVSYTHLTLPTICSV